MENSEMGIPDHLTCVLRNMYAGQESTVRNEHGRADGSNRERSTSRLYIFTLLIQFMCRIYHVKHRLDEAQPGIKIVGEISITSNMQMIPL